MVQNAKNPKIDNKEVEKKEVVLPVIPMTAYVGLNFNGESVTVEIPKSFTVLGKKVEGNVSYEFPFKGNPNNKDRLGLTRVIKFKTILPQEVDIISQLDFGTDNKYHAIALMRKTQKAKDGKIVDGKEVLSISIVDKTGNWYGANLDAQSAIDIMGLITRSGAWSLAHKYYLAISGRNDKLGGNSLVEVKTLESTELLGF